MSWPLEWQGMYKSSYLSLIAGDFGVFYYNQLYTDPENRFIYLGGWVILSFALGLTYFMIRYILSMSALLRVELLRYYFKLLHFMYLPVALGMIPIALCQYDNCSASGSQFLLSILTLVVAVVYLLGYPLYLIIHAFKQVISTDPEAYDEFIRLKEMEFLLGISHAWLTEKLYLFSSYRSSWLRIYHRSVYYFFILSLVVIHGALNTKESTKMLVLLIITGCFSVYVTVFPVYRCLSSGFFYSLTLWIITANLFIGYLKAAGYNSQTMVDANLVNILIAINATAFGLIGLIILLVCAFGLKWDVGIETVKELAVGYRMLLQDLRNAQMMILNLRTFTSFMFVKAEPVQKMVGLLEEHYKLLSYENHPLQYTIAEQIDILSFLESQIKKVTLLPNENLERDFSLLLRVINRRTNEQILISPVKRRLLLKLGVFRMFLGKRKIQPLNTFVDSPRDKRKNNNDEYNYDKYKDFDDLESSRELIIETSRNPTEDIDEAVRKMNFSLLVQITEVQLEFKDPNILMYLRDAWKKADISKLPKELYTQLFRE